jgi:nitrogen fixation-related uncharacterized protein
MSKELRMLFVALFFIFIGIVALWWQSRNCYQIEYQDLSGSHSTTVCEGKM